MKKISLFLIIVIAATGLNAQKKISAEKREQIKQEKIAFITEKLQLTTEEAEKFWPIYNSFEQKRRDLRKVSRKKAKEVIGEKTASQKFNPDELTDQQIEALIKIRFETKQKELLLEQEYIEALKTAIPLKKIFLLHQAEKEFKRNLLKKVRQYPPK